MLLSLPNNHQCSSHQSIMLNLAISLNKCYKKQVLLEPVFDLGHPLVKCI